MKAIVCTAYGTPDVLQLQEIRKPEPKKGEVLIRNHAAAVTAAGMTGRRGQPYFTRLFSGLLRPHKNVLGMELAGEIEAVGADVRSHQVGDQVFGLTGLSLGAHAEYSCLSEARASLITKPSNMSFEESVAVVEGGLTALNFLVNKANVQAGQQVLIYGASGSVGTASIQLARHLGAEVTAVCSTVNLELVKSLGAEHVIDYTREDFTKNGQSYDVIFDTVGKRSFTGCRGSLKARGIYLDAAGLGTILHMFWTSLFGKQKAIMTATYVRSASAIRRDLEHLKELIETGQIKAVIDRHYPLEETAEAHRYVDTGRKKGNVVLSLAS